MEIIELLKCQDKEIYLKKLLNCEWRAGRYLAQIILNKKIYKMCGQDAKVFILINNNEIISFCSYVFQDDINDISMYPWIGFVYTYPLYRGNRYFGLLLDYICDIAKKENHQHIFVSTSEIGLYEKYGFIFYKNMLDINKENSRVYKKII